METRDRVLDDDDDEGSDLAILRAIIGDEDKFREVIGSLGGSSIYIPRLDRKARESRVIERYNLLVTEEKMPPSKAIGKIAEQERVSTRHVYRVVAKAKVTGTTAARKGPSLRELYGRTL